MTFFLSHLKSGLGVFLALIPYYHAIECKNELSELELENFIYWGKVWDQWLFLFKKSLSHLQSSYASLNLAVDWWFALKSFGRRVEIKNEWKSEMEETFKASLVNCHECFYLVCWPSQLWRSQVLVKIKNAWKSEMEETFKDSLVMIVFTLFTSTTLNKPSSKDPCMYDWHSTVRKKLDTQTNDCNPWRVILQFLVDLVASEEPFDAIDVFKSAD